MITWDQRALKLGETMTAPDGTAYAVRRLIGRGGFSEVYEVVEEGAGKHFALKCLRLARTNKPRAIERARLEGETLKTLRHPNVLRVHAVGVREDGLIWMVMDLLEGRTLRELAQRNGGRLPVPWALEIGAAICDALSAIHVYAVHRDIKPDNVHVGDNGLIRLYDLGVGKFTQEELLTTDGFSVGTVEYMSPEQLTDPRSIDARSDLFSVGALVYELMSGRLPFGRVERQGEALAVGLRVIREQHTPLSSLPHIPAYVSQVIDRALSKAREDRFTSAAVFAQVLRMALARYTDQFGPSAPLDLVGDLPPEPPQFDPKLPSELSPSRNPLVGPTEDAPAVKPAANASPQPPRAHVVQRTIEMGHVDRASLEARQALLAQARASGDATAEPTTEPRVVQVPDESRASTPNARTAADADGEDELSRARTRAVIPHISRESILRRFGGVNLPSPPGGVSPIPPSLLRADSRPPDDATGTPLALGADVLNGRGTSPSIVPAAGRSRSTAYAWTAAIAAVVFGLFLAIYWAYRM